MVFGKPIENINAQRWKEIKILYQALHNKSDHLTYIRNVIDSALPITLDYLSISFWPAFTYFKVCKNELTYLTVFFF